ncbi:hypothetical protein LTR01_001478 [Friedmanniomyces endolithicus]|nr:hypothetical protein LTR01_001478 [Friedmanniomyces endolithicus]KAK0830900.1 hypothetical protein LTR73_003287 [Friedmanniomyces endolithicus]
MTKLSRASRDIQPHRHLSDRENALSNTHIALSDAKGTLTAPYTAMIAATTESGWVGDRQPAVDDVQRANELPQVAWLHEYKSNLLSSIGTTTHTPRIRRLPFQSSTREPDGCTYPLRQIHDVPELPSRSELDALRAVFFERFAKQDFLHAYNLPTPEKVRLPPYLELAYAAIGNALSPQEHVSPPSHSVRDATQLFQSGARLYGVITETNNFEITSPVTVLSMARSLRWPQAGHGSSMEVRRKRSALTSYVFMVVVVHALARGETPMASSEELEIDMSNGRNDFKTAYAALFSRTGSNSAGLSDNADAVILILALLSELLFLQHSYRIASSQPASTGSNESNTMHSYPVALTPVSATREYSDHEYSILQALRRWRNLSAATASNETTALSTYLELRISYPFIDELPHSCGYGPSCDTVFSAGALAAKVDDRSVRLAWLILDHVDVQKRERQCTEAVWLPSILFHSALVVWKSQTDVESGPPGSLKTLELFAKELDALPWPCCSAMARCLRNLMVHTAIA